MKVSNIVQNIFYGTFVSVYRQIVPVALTFDHRFTWDSFRNTEG